MLKFGTFVSSIPDPNTPECSSASHTEGTPKGLSRAAKGKAQADAPSKTKVPNLKKSLKTLVMVLQSLVRNKFLKTPLQD